MQKAFAVLFLCLGAQFCYVHASLYTSLPINTYTASGSSAGATTSAYSISCASTSCTSYGGKCTAFASSVSAVSAEAIAAASAFGTAFAQACKGDVVVIIEQAASAFVKTYVKLYQSVLATVATKGVAYGASSACAYGAAYAQACSSAFIKAYGDAGGCPKIISILSADASGSGTLLAKAFTQITAGSFATASANNGGKAYAATSVCAEAMSQGFSSFLGYTFASACQSCGASCSDACALCGPDASTFAYTLSAANNGKYALATLLTGAQAHCGPKDLATLIQQFLSLVVEVYAKTYGTLSSAVAVKGNAYACTGGFVNIYAQTCAEASLAQAANAFSYMIKGCPSAPTLALSTADAAVAGSAFGELVTYINARLCAASSAGGSASGSTEITVIADAASTYICQKFGLIAKNAAWVDLNESVSTFTFFNKFVTACTDAFSFALQSPWCSGSCGNSGCCGGVW
jgi:hypothetical protein